MLDKNMISVGKRVRKSRKKVGLTQTGVTGGEVTRETISQIESGKINLTIKTAEIIVKNVNKAAEENGLDYRISIGELFKGEDDVIKDLIDEHVKELKVLVMSESLEVKSKLREIEALFKNVEEEKKEKVYENVIDYFYNKYEYEEAKTYILKCHAIAFKKNENEKIIKALYNLIMIYTKKYDYKQVIKLMKQAEYTAEFSNLKKCKYMKKIYFHGAMAFRYTGNYKECIHLLKKIKSTFILGKDEILDIETILGRCYEKNKEYKKSETIFLNLLNLSIDTEYILMVALTYTNLAYVHFKQKNFRLAKIYIDKALKIKINDYDKIAEMHFRKFEIYLSFLNEFTKVKEVFYDSLHKATIVKNEKLKFMIISLMIDYCIKESNECELLKILLEFELEINSSEDPPAVYYKVSGFLRDIKSENENIIFEKGRKLLKNTDYDM